MTGASIGERVAAMLEGVDRFYGLGRTTPLAEIVSARAFETKERLAKLRLKRHREGLRVGVVVKGFDEAAAARLAKRLPWINLTEAQDADILICDPHSPDLVSLLESDALRIFWAHDHHHTFHHYTMFLLRANTVVPAHFHHRDHLQAFCAHIADTVPATSNQWSLDDIAREQSGSRHDALYGGFGAYDISLDRSLFVGALMQLLPDHALSVRHIQSLDDPYFSQTPQERLSEWRKHKVSLAHPVGQDIPIRIFDALATGQIPIIPREIVNFDWVISREDQENLGIVRYDGDDPASAAEAWRIALSNFDRLDDAGIKARVHFFLDRHGIDRRIERIIRSLPL